MRGLTLGLLAASCVAGCSPPLGPPEYTSGPVRVVVTTSILADAVRQVGGDAVTVTPLMPPGANPHSYVLTAHNSEELANAHLVFFHGLHLEGKLTDLLEQSESLRAVAVAGRIRPGQLRTADETVDPHVWFDVKLWQVCVTRVAEELAALDPARADVYRANLTRHLGELDALDAEVRRAVATIPEPKRVLVTSHDAFGYFGRAYGVEVRGLQGVSTAFETGTDGVTDLAEFIQSRQIPAVFAESSTLPNGLLKVLDSTPGVTLVGVPPLEAEALYTDSLGEAGTPAGTYAGAVRHNVAVLVKYLKPR